jgi:hypothetical protein
MALNEATISEVNEKGCKRCYPNYNPKNYLVATKKLRPIPQYSSSSDSSYQVLSKKNKAR